MKTFIFGLILLGFCCGCTEEECRQKNQKTFDSGGELIGELDGRTIKRYKIATVSGPDHYIYTISDIPSVTVNSSNGKSRRVTVMIDGESYTLLPENNQQSD